MEIEHENNIISMSCKNKTDLYKSERIKEKEGLKLIHSEIKNDSLTKQATQIINKLEN